jgi:signal transduction histidine kinase
MRQGGLLDRVAGRMLGIPVLIKIVGIPLGLSVLLVGAILWQIHETWHLTLLDELEEEGRSLGVDLATICSEAALSGDSSGLRRILESSRRLSPDIDYLMVLDSRGAVLAHTFGAPPAADLLGGNHLGPAGEIRVALLDTGRGPIRDIAVPLRDGAGDSIRVGMSEVRVIRQVEWLVGHLLRVIAVIGILGMTAAWGIAMVLTRPLRELVSLTRRVKDGDFAARARRIAGDEIGELTDAFNAMADSLGKKETLRQDLMRKVIGAAEEERRRVARELHDETGQALTSLIAGLGAMNEDSAVPPRTQARLIDLRRMAEQTLDDVHDLSLRLRPSAIDDFGLIPAVRKHCETVARRFGVQLDCQAVGLEGSERLPAEVELTAYRIVQEAVTNAVRHGEANDVHVLFQKRPSGLLVVIEDNGRGFDASDWRSLCIAGGHLGLLGMEERAALLGGTMRVESRPSYGTRLFVELPLIEGVADAENPGPDRR